MGFPNEIGEPRYVPSRSMRSSHSLQRLENRLGLVALLFLFITHCIWLHPGMVTNPADYRHEELTRTWRNDFDESIRSIEDRRLIYSTSSSTANESKHPCVSAAGTFERDCILLPPTVSTCNVSKLSFDGLHTVAEPAMFVPNHSLAIAYGPIITKAGSTTSMRTLQSMVQNNESIARFMIHQPGFFTNYTFYTFLRHPMERVLSGYSQIEYFYRWGWIEPLLDKYNLTWWNSSCINSTLYIERTLRFCQGSKPSRTIQQKVQRLSGFLDDIESNGFFDQHVTPTTFLLATSPIKEALVFTMNDINRVHKVIVEASGHEYVPKHTNKRPRKVDPDNPLAEHWQIRWSDLVTWAKTMPLAQSVVQRMCSLYRHDVECLPFDVPECVY